jgi:hypothetical protein
VSVSPGGSGKLLGGPLLPEFSNDPFREKTAIL